MIKRSLLAWCWCSLLVLTGTVASAESSPGVWQGEGELGFTSTSGNSDSENLNASLGIGQETGQWKHSASLRVIKAESEGATSADSNVLEARSEYAYGEKSYVFGKLRYEDDEFSGYDFQASLALGAGSRFVETQRHLLDASIGLGYRSIEDSVSNEQEDEGIVTADLVYEYKISESAAFKETLLVENGSENTYTESDTSLTAMINGNLAAKISYLVKRNSDVPAGIDRTDQITTVSLVYSF